MKTKISTEEKSSIVLGSKIRKARIEAGISKEDFCILIDSNLSNLNKYETGVRRPRIETLIAIADIFGYSLDYLLRDEYSETAEPIFYSEDIKIKIKEEWKNELRNDLKNELRDELIEELKVDLKKELKITILNNIDTLID